jgi:hypothetical protein
MLVLTLGKQRESEVMAAWRVGEGLWTMVYMDSDSNSGHCTQIRQASLSKNTLLMTARLPGISSSTGFR